MIAPSLFHFEGDSKRREAIQLVRTPQCWAGPIQPILFDSFEELAKTCNLIRHLLPDRRFPLQQRTPSQIDQQQCHEGKRKRKRDSRSQLTQ